MGLMGRSRRAVASRKMMARILVGMLLLWPPVHAIASELCGFSSWRYFGWGMYATPHPETLGHLSLIWMDPSAPRQSALDLLQATVLHDASCVAVFVYDRATGLHALDMPGLCDHPAVQEDLAHVAHFRSTRHLVALVDRLSAPDRQAYPVLAIFARQRLRLAPATAYTQSEVFLVRDGTVLRVDPGTPVEH